ncbi:MAG: fibrobacter succinogenes major paralogous domain-containing protein [Bacteroidales bacterium]|nr:fibrobacter succinogenes major paralogous domain-containing protein [Bacteroidales bacterium]
MKIDQKSVAYVLLLFGFLLSLSACNKEEPPERNDNRFLVIDQPGNHTDRLRGVNRYLSFHRIKQGTSTSDDDGLFLYKYQLEGPEVDGVQVQASHVIYYNHKIYLAYNTAGELVRGAFEVVDLSDADHPGVYTTGTPYSEYSSLDIYQDPGGGTGHLLLAGCTHPLTGYQRAILEIYDLNASGLPVLSPVTINLNGFVATDVSGLAVVTGTGGGLFMTDPDGLRTADYITDLEDARSVSEASGGSYVALLGSPGRLMTGLPDAPAELQLGGLTRVGTKAIVRVVNHRAYVALGEGGLKVVDLATGIVTASLPPPPVPPGENPDNYVTNGVSANEDGTVFIANGAAGIYVAQTLPSGELEVLGYLDLDASVNFVEADGDHLFAASGEKGVAIIEMQNFNADTLLGVQTLEINPSSITSSGARSGGRITGAHTDLVVVRGVCWSQTPHPDIQSDKTVNGSGGGSFLSDLSGLQPGTQYYVRAYAQTAEDTIYGNEVSFLTHSGESDNQMFTDPRDGHLYHWIKIGNQTWMAENLAWLPAVSPSASGSFIDSYYYVYDYNGFDVTEASSKSTYNKYGVLYNWMAAREACPSGWHLPTDEEWKMLEQHLGMDPAELDQLRFRGSAGVGNQIKSVTGWNNGGNGDGSSGYFAAPGGYRARWGGYKYKGDFTAFWTATQEDQRALYRGVYSFNDGIYRERWFITAGFSVRCVKD